MGHNQHLAGLSQLLAGECERLLYRRGRGHFAGRHKVGALASHDDHAGLLQHFGHDKGPLLAGRIAVAAGVIQNELDVRRISHGGQETLLAHPGPSAFFAARRNDQEPARPHDRASQAHHAIACGLQEGIIHRGEKLVCMTGNGFADLSDSLMCMQVEDEVSIADILESDPVLSATVELSMELAKGGQDGKPLGASFVVGDMKAVLRFSRQLMINPFKSYSMNVKDRRQWDLLKKYALFDGAFVVDDLGSVVAAQRFLSANVQVEIPPGLGTRPKIVKWLRRATR